MPGRGTVSPFLSLSQTSADWNVDLPSRPCFLCGVAQEAGVAVTALCEHAPGHAREFCGGPRSREFPNPPTRRTQEGDLFANAAAELGFVPYQGPGAAMTQDYVNLYKLPLSRCRVGGFCSSHVCAEGAKATPLTAVLPALYRQKTFEMRPLQYHAD